jgi:PAS domain S-box-containing protein
MPNMKRMLGSRSALALGTWVAYALAFIPLYHRLGPAVPALVTLPVIAMGWLFGTRAGLLAGLLAFLLDTLLLTLAGEAGWDMMIEGLPASLLLVLIGAVVGRLRDLGEQVKQELAKRERLEEALQKSEEKYRTILENIEDGYYEFDIAGNLTFFNDSLCRLYGYSKDELMGMNYLQCTDDETAKAVYQTYNTVYRTGKPIEAFEWEAIGKDGTRRFVQVSVSLIRGPTGEPVGFRGIVRDITERKQAEEALRKAYGELEIRVEERTAELAQANRELQAEITERKRVEEALRESEERFALAVRGSNDGIWDWDIQNNALYWSPRLKELLGYADDELEVDFDTFDSHLHPDDRERMGAAIEAHLKDGGLYDMEQRLRTKSGEYRWFRARGQALWDEAGNPLRMVGSTTDITERKRAEEQLQRYADELEQANEEVKQFAYIVSHDLRAPLTNLKGFSEELRYALEVIGSAMDMALPYLDEKQRLDVTTALQEDVPEALSFIESSVTRMDNFINAVLKLSRLGRRELKIEPVDMEVLVQATLQALAHQIEERQVRVTVGPLPEVVADRTAMEQIMSNLLGNTVKYLEPGRPGEIEITGERGGDETTFRIRDNGRGIAEEDMDKVFAPFRRAGRQDVPGEGMGLPYVQTLVRRHGGCIWCESELGVGTTFTFTLSNHPQRGGDRA